MDLNKLLDSLEEMVEHGKVPLFGSTRPFRRAFFLDVDDVLDLTHQIRASLPMQIQRAEEILKHQDEVLKAAQDKAERIELDATEKAELTLRQAQEAADEIVSKHELTRRAEIEGQRIRDAAQKEADALKARGQTYVRELLDLLVQTADAVGVRAEQVKAVAEKAREEMPL